MLGQYIREEAPESHAKKGGTPTTGGIFLVFAAILASVMCLFMAEKTSTGAFLILITFIFYMFAVFSFKRLIYFSFLKNKMKYFQCINKSENK